MAQLALTNIVTISVSAGNPGAGAYNTSNLGLFTDDAPASASATITFSGTAASGSLVVNFGGHAASAINYNDTVQAIQNKFNAVSGAANIVVTGTVTGAGGLTLSQPGIFGSLPAITFGTNSLQTSGSVAVTPSAAVVAAGWSGGTGGYAAYVAPTQVGLDFGTGSKTFAMANGVFSQQPNILTGNGQLIIILMNVSQWTLGFSGVAASGAFEITYNSNATASIAWNAATSTIQSDLQAVTGCAQAQVTGTITGETLTIILFGVYGAGQAISTASNTLMTSAPASITVSPSQSVTGETIGAAVTRTASLVQYFGVMVNESCGTGQVIPSADVTALAAVLLPLVKIGFMVTNSSTDLTAVTGMIAVLTASSFTNTRMLYYGDTSSSGIQNALVMAASYAGLALSVNFNGSLTTTTMHLKVLAGVAPDPSMTQTILNEAVACGADVYVSLQGVSAVFISGANTFYDNVYNLLWFTGALQIAGFNYLAQTGTKVPQTESGMDGLKGAYKSVCQQAVTNGYCAPGSWTSATTFGNNAQLLANVSQVGFYIYSQPVAQQLQTARAARQAPVVQIAIKEAGAIQSSNVIVAVNP
jgi:hypothetical protein